MASTTNAAGNTTSYTYDAQGRQLTSTNPDGKTTTYGYDAAGKMITVETPDGKTTTNTYDPAGNVTSTSYSDGVTPNATSIVYDPDGDRVSMTDGTGTTRWSYDAFGELTQTTNGAGATVSYGYNPDGKMTSVGYPDGSVVTDTYNTSDQLTAVQDAGSHTTNFTYTADGLPNVTTYPNGTTVTDAYNNADQQTSTTLNNGGTTLGAITYGRDNAGQLSSSTPSGSLPGAAQTYTYTGLQQLKSVTAGTTSNYSYDAANDPTGLAGTTSGYDPASELCWSTTGTVTGSPGCTSPPTGATTYSYNSDGERTATTPVSGTASSYSYNQADELTAATTPAGSGTYNYDGDGLRQSKTVTGTTTHFTWGLTPAGNSAVLTDSTNNYIYGPQGLPIEQISGTTANYYVADQDRNTVALTGSAGTITATYTYNAYGAVTAHTGTTATPLQYGQGYTDNETGLIYLTNRYYDPSTGQFLTVDPLSALTLSPYGYVDDNPVNATDPTGLGCGIFSPGDCIKDAAGAVGGAAKDVGNGVATGAVWAYHHPAQVGAVAGGIALAATGVGAVADAGIIGSELVGTAAAYTGVASGLVATGADALPCIQKGDALSCAGAAAGAVSLGFGGTAVRLGAGALRVGLDAGAFTFGVGGLTWDLGNIANSLSDNRCP